MPNLRDIQKEILATGKVDSQHLKALRACLYADGKVDREEVDLLTELHKRVQHPNPAFEEFYYGAVKDHVLADGRIDAEETAWLRQMLFADGKVDEFEKRFLRDLKAEAKSVSREFQQLYDLSNIPDSDAVVAEVVVQSSDNFSRTFRVGLYVPAPAGTNQNQLQGLSSTFGLTWHIDQ